jgi:nitrate/TMAO reductase-like tetraheme cytochrome c subunit
MSRSAYSRTECWVCGKVISTNGFAQTNHQRKHVREGILKEVHPDMLSGIRFELVNVDRLNELYPEEKEDG